MEGSSSPAIGGGDTTPRATFAEGGVTLCLTPWANTDSTEAY